MTPNPFPGINPYVEPFWNDFGAVLTNRIWAALNTGHHPLPIDLRASIQRRDVLANPGDRFGMARWWIEIVRRVPDGEPYTAIEVLNPVEKRMGDGRDQFRRLQRRYAARAINRVVIDLLRGGRRPLYNVDDSLPPAVADRAYRVTVFRGDQPGTTEVYPLSLRDRLPKVPVPLRPAESDAVIDLQPLVDDVYATGRYPINYAEPCDPPLTGEDAAWAAEVIARFRER